MNGIQTWKQTFGYDLYGNRTSRYQIIGNQELPINNLTLPSIDSATNRFTANQGYIYDQNGNIIADPASNGRMFVFNGDNKQTEVRNSQNVVIGRYYYDGNGKRIKKVTDAETTIFVLDGLGKLIAEYSTVTPPEVPKINYTATDQIGSPRVITDTFGMVESRRDFMPFGEELFADGTNRKTSDDYGNTGGDAVRQRFTGFQRDLETNLDFAEARYFNSSHGRFSAVDPLLASGKSARPQTFNRYVYALNEPLGLVDPTGLQAGKPAPPQQDKKPEVTVIENPKASSMGNTHIAIKGTSAFAYNNEKQIKNGEGNTIKTTDGKDAHYGFGVKVDYKINLAEGIRAKDISVKEDTTTVTTLPDGSKDTRTFTKTIQANEKGEFKDEIGVFLDVPIPAGATSVTTQKLSVTATYVLDDGTTAKSTDEFRTNEVTINTGDKGGNRTIKIEDKTKYEDNTLPLDDITKNP